jgi:Fe-S cluster biogenesis protein NfuA
MTDREAEPTVTTTPDARRVGARVEQLLDGLAAADDPRSRAQAEELVRLLLELYGAGLTRIIDIVLGELDDPLRFAELLASDELVSSLLVLHGLHPQDVEQRVSSVLRSLGSQADGARLLGVDPDGVARVQLRRTGCSSTAAAARQKIERAITTAVPDVTSVTIHELPRASAGPQLIPLEGLFRDHPAPVPR